MEKWFLRHMPADDDLLELIEWAFVDGEMEILPTRLTS